jgi:dsDNA-specific endonuclease/ATPase MutS2
MIVDLHIVTESEHPLSVQIDLFERELDRALVCGHEGMVVIHGIGEGILKREVHRICSLHPHVSEYRNEYHPLYGWGSTKIVFR